jgi:hypothetical protein
LFLLFLLFLLLFILLVRQKFNKQRYLGLLLAITLQPKPTAISQ